MNRAFRISFSLKNTYRVNNIIHALKQIPLINRLLPQTLYRSEELKILGNVLAGLWEIATIFAGKFLYYVFMIFLMGSIYEQMPSEQVFLHILVCLTAIGAFMNTAIFNPTKDKYYAMILLGMDARAYTISNYIYAILKVIVGTIPSALLFGWMMEVPVGICLLVPFAVAGAKMAVAASYLRDYEKRGVAHNENQLGRYEWLVVGVLMAAAYGLPAVGFVIPFTVSIGIMILAVAAGLLSLRKILGFHEYRDVYQQILISSMNQMDAAREKVKNQTKESILADTRITSNRKGFEYLNELFIKRHQKILWKSSKRIAMISLMIVAMGLLGCYMQPKFGEKINVLLMTFLPYFVFIMYMINRGTIFTQALFMNCDCSLLTYPFYKKPDMILRFFAIRLREIIKVNLLPAVVIGGGLAILLFASGGTENPMNYVVIVVSILSMSIFFSVHYLTLYYLLQPYTEGAEMKSGTYRVIMMATYIVCWLMMQQRLPTLVFGAVCILFCVLYCIAACILVYRMAPRTFRIRT